MRAAGDRQQAGGSQQHSTNRARAYGTLPTGRREVAPASPTGEHRLASALSGCLRRDIRALFACRVRYWRSPAP
jgi:hypothetical protein